MPNSQTAKRLSSSEINLIYKKGKKIYTENFVFFYRLNRQNHNRFAISLNSKTYRNSTSRNRLKRRLQSILSKYKTHIFATQNNSPNTYLDIILSPHKLKPLTPSASSKKIKTPTNSFLHFKPTKLNQIIQNSINELNQNVSKY